MSIRLEEIEDIIAGAAGSRALPMLRASSEYPGEEVRILAEAIMDYFIKYNSKFRVGDIVKRRYDYKNAKRKVIYGVVVETIHKDDIVKYKVKWDEPSGIWNHKKGVFNPNGGRIFSTIQEKSLSI